jgi:23S rRNA (guanosine2251-2'-O)-methyltransferase
MPCVVLHNIRSVHNVGSIFRTADAAGVGRIFLTGYTPTPLDRFDIPRKDFAKVSLGAEKSVQWTYRATLAQALRELREEGYYIAAVEQNKNSISLFKFRSRRRDPAKGRGKTQKKPLAIVLGNEVRGLSPAALEQVDKIVEIPMRGKKESLNVSVAAGVALFTLLRELQ